MENAKDEYLDASANMRHYSNMRFAQLTLFLGLNAGLISVLSGINNGGLVLKLFGLLGTIAFLIMENRAESYFHAYRTRAVSLETELGFSQHSERPEASALNTILSSRNAVFGLYAAVIILWIALIVGVVELNPTEAVLDSAAPGLSKE